MNGKETLSHLMAKWFVSFARQPLCSILPSHHKCSTDAKINSLLRCLHQERDPYPFSSSKATTFLHQPGYFLLQRKERKKLKDVSSMTYWFKLDRILKKNWKPGIKVLDVNKEEASIQSLFYKAALHKQPGVATFWNSNTSINTSPPSCNLPYNNGNFRQKIFRLSPRNSWNVFFQNRWKKQKTLIFFALPTICWCLNNPINYKEPSPGNNDLLIILRPH